VCSRFLAAEADRPQRLVVEREHGIGRRGADRFDETVECCASGRE
jgi:hypothetical protein